MTHIGERMTPENLRAAEEAKRLTIDVQFKPLADSPEQNAMWQCSAVKFDENTGKYRVCRQKFDSASAYFSHACIFGGSA